jgi:mono/diheme cytochrome c family protein
MRTTAAIVIGCLGVLGVGCGGDPPAPPARGGALTASLPLAAVKHDVDAVRFDLVAADGACDGPALATQTVAASGPKAEALFLHAPGSYKLCASPRAGGQPSKDCARAEAPATIEPAQTREVMLVSQCKGAPGGGLAAAVLLNDPPQLTSLTVAPSTSITVCQAARLAAVALDPDGDAVTIAWTLLSGPPGARLVGTGAAATFSATEAGAYTLQVTAEDAHGARASLTVPVRVAGAVCAVPANVQALFAAKCGPCHTTGTSGMLGLGSAEASYVNLVDKPATGCTGRTRVLRGAPAQSYLVHKLREAMPACGRQMPRNAPPLAEEEIQSIEAWISSLPPR